MTVDSVLVRLVGVALFFDFLLVTMVIPILPSMFVARELEAGVLFAAKPAFQVLFNPLVARHFENSAALRLGTVVGAIGSMLFGVVRQSFPLLVAVRALQGAASAGVLTGGMSLLLSQHSDDDQGPAASGALLGLTLGVSMGPVFGGPAYDAFGRAGPFLLVGLLMLLLAGVQHVVLDSNNVIVAVPAADTELGTLAPSPHAASTPAGSSNASTPTQPLSPRNSSRHDKLDDAGASSPVFTGQEYAGDAAEATQPTGGGNAALMTPTDAGGGAEEPRGDGDDGGGVGGGAGGGAGGGGQASCHVKRGEAVPAEQVSLLLQRVVEQRQGEEEAEEAQGGRHRGDDAAPHTPPPTRPPELAMPHETRIGVAAKAAGSEPGGRPPPPPRGGSQDIAWRSLLQDSSVITVGTTMMVVSLMVGALEPIVAYTAYRTFDMRPWEAGLLWGFTVPFMHGLTTLFINFAQKADAFRAWEPERWVAVGLVLSAVGAPLIGVGALVGGGGSFGGILLSAIGLAMQGACLGCVITMVQPLLGAIAKHRGDTVAPLMAISNSGQSFGFVVGPLIGGVACASGQSTLAKQRAAAREAAEGAQRDDDTRNGGNSGNSDDECDQQARQLTAKGKGVGLGPHASSWERPRGKGKGEGVGGGGGAVVTADGEQGTAAVVSGRCADAKRWRTWHAASGTGAGAGATVMATNEPHLLQPRGGGHDTWEASPEVKTEVTLLALGMLTVLLLPRLVKLHRVLRYAKIGAADEAGETLERVVRGPPSPSTPVRSPGGILKKSSSRDSTDSSPGVSGEGGVFVYIKTPQP